MVKQPNHPYKGEENKYLEGSPLESIRDGKLNVRPYPEGEKSVQYIPTQVDDKMYDAQLLEYWDLHYPPVKYYEILGAKHPLYSENVDQEMVFRFMAPTHIEKVITDAFELTKFGLDTIVDNELYIPKIWFTVNNKNAPFIGWVAGFYDRLWYITSDWEDRIMFPNSFMSNVIKYHVRLYHPTVSMRTKENA